MKHQYDRRQFLIGAASVSLAGVAGVLLGCSASGSESASSGAGEPEPAENSEPITFVFLPDASSADLTASRDAVEEFIREATGREAEIMTSTDYNVAIEALASGSAGMALLGAEGYVQAHRKNPNVQAAFTNSDEDGSLDGACYYSRICVRTEDVDQYKSGSGYTLEPLEGKSFSFVSATSTSGFKVPSATIVSTFDLDSNEVLLENGAFFSEVLLGGSHQGSVVNLVNGDADAAAFDDIDVDMYLSLVSGEANMPGAVYKVRDDAGDPFTSVHGKEFTIIAVTPVLNAPFCYNGDVLDEAAREALTAYFCSDIVANDSRIFKDPDDEDAKALYEKDSEKTCFLPVDDAWYEPIRKLSQA
ncbi:MAG: phosphate/phosphite/phosphonate ABC transporter substrate-binding protein [Coriobacteriales bacterium]|jgi:phosphonate transport system substrate-binding protein|nr:phosphate/phosphite/phosphonate ABC transporter substrate-binding protein [Coriobacteriales bacterium]